MDSPRRGHSFEPSNVRFAPFSRSLVHTFTLGQNFGPLTIRNDSLGYRHAIVKLIPGLDSPYQEHSFGPSNAQFAPFSRLLLYTFRP